MVNKSCIIENYGSKRTLDIQYRNGGTQYLFNLNGPSLLIIDRKTNVIHERYYLSFNVIKPDKLVNIVNNKYSIILATDHELIAYSVKQLYR